MLQRPPMTHGARHRHLLEDPMSPSSDTVFVVCYLTGGFCNPVVAYSDSDRARLKAAELDGQALPGTKGVHVVHQVEVIP